MNLDAYDDMMGLEFGDNLSALLDAQVLKEALIASTAGGGAILAATWGVKKLAAYIGLETKVTDPLARAAVVSTVTFLAGILGGRSIYNYNREAAMGVVGGLGGLAMANLLDAALNKFTGSARMITALGEANEGMYSPDGMRGAYDDAGMSALAQLEATSVQAAPGAFQGFAGPTVTPEALMGFGAAETQTEHLGEYAPYLA